MEDRRGSERQTARTRTLALAAELDGLAAAWDAEGHGQRAFVVRGCAADLRALVAGMKE